MTTRLLYRAMLQAEDGAPQVGDRSHMLGVRPGIDVRSATAGPGSGGMSVIADDPSRMRPDILPGEHGGLNPETVLYVTPDSTFVPATGLLVGPIHPKKRHGVVEAASPCSIQDFQVLLANTRPVWSRVNPRSEPSR